MVIMPMTDAFLIVCNHGLQAMPAAYLRLLRGKRDLLNTLRYWDPGAIRMAKSLAGAFGSPLASATISRIFQINSSCHDGIQPESDEPLSRRIRAVQVPIREINPEGVIDSSLTNIELFYCSGKRAGAALDGHWRSSVFASTPEIDSENNLLHNRSGSGASHLRLRYPGSVYVGIDLEINPRIVLAAGNGWMTLRRTLVDSLRHATLPISSKINACHVSNQHLRYHATQRLTNS